VSVPGSIALKGALVTRERPLRAVQDAFGAPEHLSARSRELWARIVRDYDLDVHHLELLRLALEALDRCEQARQALADEGMLTTNRYGVRVAHPAVAIERDSRLAAARLFRELDLEGEPLPDPRMRRRR
jgi:phage terminase small subunit